MLRVNSSNVLVVPPFECAWISDEAGPLKGSSGCVTFEARGENDATIILKAQAGSRRIQQIEPGSATESTPHEYVPHYTIIFGSHQNSCLKIEKGLDTCFKVSNAGQISGSNFTPCWLIYDRGKFRLGTGRPGTGTQYTWEDTEPIPGIKHVGLGSWNNHLCFRNVAIQSPLPSLNATADFRDNLDCQVPQLTELCKRALMESIEVCNVCQALLAVDLLSPELDTVAPKLVAFLAQNVEGAASSDPESYEALPAALIAELLGNPCLECREIVVFQTLVHWAYGSQIPVKGHLRQSVPDVEGLLLLIRFPLMSPQELQNLRGHHLAADVPLLHELLHAAGDAKMFQPSDSQGVTARAVEGKRLIKAGSTAQNSIGPQLPASLKERRFHKRLMPDSKNLMFVSNGDANGITSWLGTSYGTSNWINPLLSGSLQLQASSPNCKHTDPRAIVSSKFQRLNFAGPGKSGTWWRMVLGYKHRLILNYYTLRHDGSADYPRHWVLQGSTDGVGWVNLKRHRNDCSISTCGQIMSWPVTGHAASMPYRMFQVVLQGPNASLSGKRNTFHLSQFELYGHFFRLE